MDSKHTSPHKQKSSKWTHPVHARGVRSPQFGSAVVGAHLSNKKIHHYAKLGFYGTENQLAAIAADKKKKKSIPKANPLAAALKLLGL